ncbi:ROK family protein [Undibacterium sp. Ren11W]|uniref:ROK family protein n=1 Tax=Undibacterium sp. Ren11W TaxID=3413045 RepID=UPI003BEF9027
MDQVIAFDIGGTNSRIALFEHGKIIWRDEAITPGQQGPTAMLETMLGLLPQLEARSAPIVVAIAAQIIDACVNANNQSILRGWNNFPLASVLSERAQRPVRLINDARAAAWGEYVYGAGRDCEQFLFVTISTGIGAGLVLNGRLHLARNGYEAELGETLTEHGQMLEDLASGSALARLALQNGYASARLFCDAADAGDIQADALYRSGIREVAKKIADLVVMLGIQKVAVGGGLGLRVGYLARLQDEMKKFPPTYQCELVAASLGHDAGLYGAAAYTTMR